MSPFFKKIPHYKSIQEWFVSTRNINGYDYIFFGKTSTSKDYAYNIDTGEFLMDELPTVDYSKDELLYYGETIYADSQTRNSQFWDYLERQGNLQEIYDKSLVEEPGWINVGINAISSITVDKKDFKSELNLFKEFPDVKRVFEKSSEIDFKGDGSSKEFKILTRQGQKGTFPPPPVEPSKPIKIPDIDLTPYKLIEDDWSLSGLIYSQQLQEYEKKHAEYEKKMLAYQSYKEVSYAEQTQLYFSPEEQVNDYLHWLGNENLDSLIITVTNEKGQKKQIHSFNDMREWVNQNKTDSQIKYYFRDY